MKATTLIFSLVIATLMAGCKSTTPTALTTAETTTATQQPYAVPYTIAQGYFVRNDVDSLPSNRIITREQFDSLFGMAAVMGENGMPTSIDFDRQFVIAVDVPVTDRITSIIPESLEFVPAPLNPSSMQAKIVAGSTIEFTYKVQIGAPQSFSTHPVLILVVDRRYNAPVVTHRCISFLSH